MLLELFFLESLFVCCFFVCFFVLLLLFFLFVFFFFFFFFFGGGGSMNTPQHKNKSAIGCQMILSNAIVAL